MEKHVVKPLIPAEEVEKRIVELADQLNRDYAGKTVHMIGILKGSVPFLCALAKHLTVPVTMDFMSCSSYGSGTTSSGAVRLNKDLDESIEGRDVLLVEDIIDTGHTLSYLVNLLKDRKPASLKLAALLNKPSRRTCPVDVDYSCFMIEDVFVVGYGLDYDQRYRNLDYVGYVEFI
ncbi:MAG: hypoxanthine phosphoribosyltransferase [Lachnospiraceae bacterium]|nr:hypoxanthine phosphoribosyltransferase [Lachnospiraceae bacterium]